MGVALDEANFREQARKRSVTAVHRAQRGHDTGFLTALAERIARILTAPIGVLDNTLRAALYQHHFQPRKPQLRFQVRLHSPSHETPRIHIQHDRHCLQTLPARS